MRILVILLVMAAVGVGTAAFTRRWYLGIIVSVTLGAALFLAIGHIPPPIKQPTHATVPTPDLESTAATLVSIAQLPDNARLADGRFPDGHIRREMQILRVFVVEYTLQRELGSTPRQSAILNAFHASLLSRIPSAPSFAYLKDSAVQLKLYRAAANAHPESVFPTLGRQFSTLVDPRGFNPVYAATGEQICTEVSSAVLPFLQLSPGR
jgi:hypothetical protein